MPSSQLSVMNAALSGNRPALLLAQTDQSLTSSGSSWMVSTGQHESLLHVDGAAVAIADGGTYYVSTDKHGGAEAMLANWLRARQRRTVFHVPLVGQGLNDAQAAAAQLAMSAPVACLSGLPGTGKTYTARALCDSLRAARMSVQGCALTGIASKRLSDSAQIPATTIHRLLKFDGDDFQAGKLETDALIVDECSMVSPRLLLALCSRLPQGSRLILIGDPNQLPSVEPGDVFRDLCELVPHAHLTAIIRQEADSPLGNAAAAILAGSVPQTEQSPTGIGGVWIAECEGLSIDGKGKRIANHPLTIAESMAVKDKTELRAVRTMAYSNKAVQALNAQFTTWRSRKRERVPVLCLRNRHELGVYNGDIGYRDYNAQVFDGKTVILRQSEQADAWATTVHKLQGQECLSAQMWIEPYADRQVAYTALTRAKRRFVFVGNPRHLAKCIQTDPPQRLTLLRQLLHETATLIER